ncbi:MAG: class I SAM-dependent methyltransferase [Candidatus Contendobacter sp.]|nr:class I SAM-dependent methyltransferase [Candidatus Contendobacter sp.]
MTDPSPNISSYRYANSELNHSHGYLLPTVLRLLDGLNLPAGERRLFELGCGNGSVAQALTQCGWDVTGVDPSLEGIAQAQRAHPDLKLRPGSAYDDLAAHYGQFPVVLSLEVVEHVYFPRAYAATVFSLLRRGGTAILSTPYHGYWKNLALALSGKMDQHFTALWDHGHIKFWSMKTLAELLREAGFTDIHFHRVGRIPPLAKAMIAVARRLGPVASCADSRLR